MQMVVRLPARPDPLVKLENDMRAARELFEKNGHANAKRNAVCLLLLSFRQFIDERWPNEGLEVPIEALKDALFALDEGRTEPMLSAARINGRPRNSHRDSAHGRIAAILGWLIDQKNPNRMRLADAAKLIADRLRRRGQLVPAATILSWRKEALERPNGDRLVRDYKFWLSVRRESGRMLADWPAEFQIDPETLIDIYLPDKK